MDLAKLINEKTSDAQALGRSPIKRRKIAFILPTEDVCPGVFMDSSGAEYDLKVVMEALSSADEIASMGNVKNAGEVVHEYVKRSLFGAELIKRGATVEEISALEVKKMNPDQKLWIWEAIESAGRQVLLDAFNEYLGSASTAALGKYRNGLQLL